MAQEIELVEVVDGIVMERYFAWEEEVLVCGPDGSVWRTQRFEVWYENGTKVGRWTWIS